MEIDAKHNWCDEKKIYPIEFQKYAWLRYQVAVRIFSRTISQFI